MLGYWRQKQFQFFPKINARQSRVRKGLIIDPSFIFYWFVFLSSLPPPRREVAELVSPRFFCPRVNAVNEVNVAVYLVFSYLYRKLLVETR